MPRITPVASPVTFELDGQPIAAREGEPIASAILAADEPIFSRSPKYHRPRGPYCLTGECAHCLMRVDGVPNVATCQVSVRAGMRVERQNALPDANVDLLRANDFVFRDWFNHHEFLAGVPIAGAVLQKIARQLSGLGTLPEREAPHREPAKVERHSLVIVGGGRAGAAAARRLHELAVPFVLFDRSPSATIPGARAAEVVGLFADDGEPFLTVVEHQRLHLVFYERLLLAPGGHATLPSFPNNDLPGVMSSHAVGVLVTRDGVLPGSVIACVGARPEAQRLALLLEQAQARAVTVGETVVRAHGLRQVTHVTTKESGKVACDVIAVCDPCTPAFELARAGGAHVRWDVGSRAFTVEADPQGRTARLNIFVAGDIRGLCSEDEAEAQGRDAANALGATR